MDAKKYLQEQGIPTTPAKEIFFGRGCVDQGRTILWSQPPQSRKGLEVKKVYQVMENGKTVKQRPGYLILTRYVKAQHVTCRDLYVKLEPWQFNSYRAQGVDPMPDPKKK